MIMEVGKVLGIKEIKAILPHRYPLLMLDRAQQIDENNFWAVKNLSANELFFQGHFPGHPIMPGVLQVEAMKQLCELAVREKLDLTVESDVYMRLLEKVKFRSPVVPGDRLKLEAELVSLEAGEAVLVTKATNSSGVTCEARITLAVRERCSPESMPVLFTEFDRSETTAVDSEGIMELLPHRYPFLLIDSAPLAEEGRVVVIKNLTVNEEIFCGCPEEDPVLPESLLCEILAQAGCASVLARPENKGKLGYFAGIQHAESFRAVRPGDQLVCDLDLPPTKKAFGKGTGIIKVGDEVVFKITLLFAIVDR